MPELYRLVVVAPMSVEQVNSENWQQTSFCFQCLKEADTRPKTSRQQNDYRLAADFFLLECPNLSNRTRSVVQSTLSSMLDGLMRGVARELLSSPETNITPEMTQDGKLILIDLPLKVWGDIGQFIQAESLAMRAELQRQQTLLVEQQDRLLNLRLSDDIDQTMFARKSTELRDRLAAMKLQLDAVDRSHDETAQLETKVFELSQTLSERWLAADYATKRQILEIVCLNCRLGDTTPVFEMRKHLDILAEGLLVSSSRGDKTPLELFIAGVRGWEAGLRRRMEDAKPF